jgi:hypothetical protein
MPQRSTPFQKLVLHIQEQLVEGASVVESAMLRHRGTGAEREVDVVVRATAGEHTVVISLECIEQSRPADQPWIEKMKAKHEHLETNKLVLVSLSGFYAPALELAAFYGITTYTPDEACNADWTEVVGLTKLFVFRYDYTPGQTWLLLDTPQGRTSMPAGGSTRVYIPLRYAARSLGELISEVIHHKNFAVPAANSFEGDYRGTMEPTFTLDEPFFAATESGDWLPVAAVRVNVAVERTSSPIDMRSLGWKGTPASFGSAPTVVGDTVLTVVEKAPGSLNVKMIVDGKDVAAYPI